jgi:superfamily II DNA or RNA helicase/HKD family nuclease/predicted house-cleaning noncanonical NTP pyrophosphatase (MazG superfamily)
MSPAPPEKLIRDRIPELAAAEQRQLALRQASPDEMARLLGLKLVEETHEVLDAVRAGSATGILDELADLQTVIEAIGARHGLSRQDIDQRAAEKLTKRGGFDAGWVLQGSTAAPAAGTNRLHSGMGPSLLDALKHEFETCRVARLAVAFVMQSGLDLIEGAALAALLRGAELRILTTDYLGVTEPEALSRLAAWHGDVQAKIYSHARRSFHPKAYLFERVDGSGRAFIGSANLSRMALTEGVEWTWSVLDVDAGQPMYELTTRFEELFEADASRPLTPDWIREYSGRRVVATRSISGIETPIGVRLTDGDRAEIRPREVQQLALRELERLRQDGETRALVVAATGLGKTFLAAFDAREAERVLFVAHREELLRQAEAAFRAVYPTRSIGWLADGRDELDRDFVFASVQTLSRPEHLERPELSGFDYVVIDEFHHAAADSYLRVLQALSPRFLLGLTATPFRGDQRDLLALCDGNLAYQVGLLEAITYGWLVPFRYHGVADVVTYTDDLLTARKTYDTGRLTLRFNTAERAELALQHYRRHKGRATLGFCVSIDHADFMAAEFRKAGVPAAAVHSGASSMDRTEAVRQLENGQVDVLFTVDLFNEGVDIPAVDLVMFLRPTESMTIYLQQLGRGLRLLEGKAYLTVLDFIGNYRHAHVKLPLLAGQDMSQDPDPGQALRALTRWIQDGVRPDDVPDGIEIAIEPVALRALRESLDKASPLRQLVLDDLTEMTEELGRPPTLTEWQRQGRYSLRTACNALGVDRWHRVLEAGGLLDPDTRALEATVGEFLREIEKTAMTKSFKMVVLHAMCRSGIFRDCLPMTDLVVAFREYFSQERHRDDVMGTEVEAVATVGEPTWQGYLQRNPIAAWTGANAKSHSPYFSWDGTRSEFRYIGPTLPEGLQARFAQAVADRIEARLETYWQRPGPGRFVFNVIPAGGGDDTRNLCIMFGTNRDGLPVGWHLVKINGRHLYGNFVKVALNVLKERPTDDRAVPNVLTEELTKLFEGTSGRKHRVRFLRQTGAEVWETQRA